MKALSLLVVPVFVLACSTIATAQTTRPTNQPAGGSASAPSPKAMSADQMLGQMLRPTGTPAKVLQPAPDGPAVDKTSGAAAVKPGAPAVTVIREGTYLPDRLGRLTHSADGTQAEFVFESDGKALRDPPLILLPSLKLMAMENAVVGANRDLKFRISGTITEYKGRNYVLIEKAVVVPDVTQQF